MISPVNCSQEQNSIQEGEGGFIGSERSDGETDRSDRSLRLLDWLSDRRCRRLEGGRQSLTVGFVAQTGCIYGSRRAKFIRRVVCFEWLIIKKECFFVVIAEKG